MEPQMDTPENVVKMKREFSLGGKVRSLRTMSAEDFSKLPTGHTGAELSQVNHHAETLYGEKYDLVGEEFLDALHVDHSKIQELMDHLGETREEVSIVAHTRDGGFTRMFFRKESDGHYKEVEGKKSYEKERGHRQEKDIYIFEKGAKDMANAA